MFANLFMYFGPMWSAALLLAVVILPFAFALVETLRLAHPGPNRPCVPAIRLLRFRQRLVHAFATAYAGNVGAARRRLLRLSAVGSRRLLRR